jgi:pyruvate dehydrogenase E2 component (dihydrolipoamide acetyltransferase)
MTSVFYLPDLGEGLIEATVLSWLVSAGDQVDEGQPIVEVETTKSAVEIPAGFTGTVVALHAAGGDVVRVGQPLFSYSDDRSDDADGGIVGTVPRATSKPERRIRLRPPDDD